MPKLANNELTRKSTHEKSIAPRMESGVGSSKVVASLALTVCWRDVGG